MKGPRRNECSLGAPSESLLGYRMGKGTSVSPNTGQHCAASVQGTLSSQWSRLEQQGVKELME